MRSLLLLSFALLPTAALAQARTISSVAPETTMSAAISGAPALTSAIANSGEPAHPLASVHIRESIRAVVNGNPVSADDQINSFTFGHPNFESAPKLVRWSNVPVATADLAKRSGETSVAVSMLVDRGGVPENLQIAKSAGPAIDKSVLATVKDFRFAAATEDHTPVEKMMTVTVVFHKN